MSTAIDKLREHLAEWDGSPEGLDAMEALDMLTAVMDDVRVLIATEDALLPDPVKQKALDEERPVVHHVSNDGRNTLCGIPIWWDADHMALPEAPRCARCEELDA
jgi:hypothetical protein